MDWQSIETAPKDGTNILLIATLFSMLIPEQIMTVGHYSRGWWTHHSISLSYVTHWMPLPKPPIIKEEA